MRFMRLHYGLMFVALATLILGRPAWAQDARSEVDLLSVVNRGRLIIQEEIDREAKDPKREPVIVTSRAVRLRVKLAIWNELDDSITLVRLTKGEGKVVAVEHPSFRIRLKRDNGVNSEFVILSHPELHVVALKHPVFVDISTSKTSKWRLDNVVYTPYSSYLKTPSIIAAGEKYLDEQVGSVYSELRSLGIKSRAFPQQYLVDAIDPLVAQAIIAIEHVSAAALITGNVTDYLDTFATTLALNKQAAYAYARSSASARGLAQFIPSTYSGLVRARPDLKLIPNFEHGMSDPQNAIKAQVALLDINLTALPPEVRIKYEASAREVGALLAAMYNGGSTRPRRAVTHWGDKWAQNHTADLNAAKADEAKAKGEVKRLKGLLASKNISSVERARYKQELAQAERQQLAAANAYSAGTRASLKLETILYVAKFYLLYDHLAANNVAPASGEVAGVRATQNQ